MTRAAPALPRIPGYTVGRAVGHGYSGAVHFATQTRTGRPVALKILDPARLADPRALARFAREAELLARNPHPCLVALVDRGLDQDPPWLAFAWMAGGDLAARTGPRRLLPTAAAIGVGARVARALAHLHAAGVVHRDVKPANVLLDDEGGAFLGDLGLGKDLGAGDSLTASGAVVGTWTYMAPEVQAAHPAVPASDLFSLAMVLVELLTGKLPARSSRGTVLPESKVLAGPAAALVPVLRQSLRAEPEDRPAFAAVLAEACEAWGKGGT